MAVKPLKTKPKPYPQITVTNPGGGLNSFVAENLIKDTEASDLLNIGFTESGCPTKSAGRTAWGSGLSGTPLGLGSFNVPNSSHYVVTIDGTALKYTQTVSDSWTSVTGATFTASKPVTFTQAGGKLFIWNGTDGGAYWDGTTLSRPGTMPSASFSIYYQNVHLAAGTGTQGSRIYVSSSADMTDFTNNTAGTNQPNNSTNVPGSTSYPAAGAGTAAQFFDVQPDDGTVITGLAKFQAGLIIFKENSIFQMTFNPSTGVPVVTPIVNYLGAVSHRSIDNVDNDVYYLTRLGWFVLGNEPQYFTLIRTNELSARIHPIVETITPANLSQCASIYAPYVFYSSFPSGGASTNNLTVSYDRRYGAWSKVDYIHASAFTVYENVTGTQYVLYASSDSANVYILDNTSQNVGSAINSYWTSKAYDAGDSQLYKRWIDCTFLFRQISGTLALTFYDEGQNILHMSTISNTSGAQLGAMGAEPFFGGEVFGGPILTQSSTQLLTTDVAYRVKLSTTSRTIKVKIANNSLNENFVLLGLYFTYRPYSHFKFPSQYKIN